MSGGFCDCVGATGPLPTTHLLNGNDCECIDPIATLGGNDECTCPTNAVFDGAACGCGLDADFNAGDTACECRAAGTGATMAGAEPWDCTCPADSTFD